MRLMSLRGYESNSKELMNRRMDKNSNNKLVTCSFNKLVTPGKRLTGSSKKIGQRHMVLSMGLTEPVR